MTGERRHYYYDYYVYGYGSSRAERDASHSAGKFSAGATTAVTLGFVSNS